MQTLVLIEHRDGELLKPSLEALGEALDMAEAVGEATSVAAILLFGEIEAQTATKLVNELAQYGPSQIITIHHPALTHFDAAAWTQAIQYTQSSIIGSQSLFLLSATPNGRELAPYLAVKLGAGMVADSVRVRLEAANLVATVPLFNDRVYSQQQITNPVAVISFRPGARGLDRPSERSNIPPVVTEIRLDAETVLARTQHSGYVSPDPRTVTLSEAERIVCGGAGVGQENFDMMWALADEVGAAVGGTRVAVDKGWLDWDRQIGQTGQVVAPRLFISCGTSGASQHITGMKDSRTVVVINSDRNAPIFSLADIGVVGDVHEIVPLLMRKLRQRRAEANLAEAVSIIEKEEALQ